MFDPFSIALGALALKSLGVAKVAAPAAKAAPPLIKATVSFCKFLGSCGHGVVNGSTASVYKAGAVLQPWYWPNNPPPYSGPRYPLP